MSNLYRKGLFVYYFCRRRVGCELTNQRGAQKEPYFHNNRGEKFNITLAVNSIICVNIWLSTSKHLVKYKQKINKRENIVGACDLSFFRHVPFALKPLMT